ncbi:MAG: Ig-like domain-containing protein [Candidatus Paceibacterota bacterium]|jgi:hypothetical protein|nr:Ig-like domain-containing protein [Candidatus Paceibacterota bacterium]
MKNTNLKFLFFLFLGVVLLSPYFPHVAESASTHRRIFFPNAKTIDTQPPEVAITSATAGATTSATITVRVAATDNVGVAGVKLRIDGEPMRVGPYGTQDIEDTIPPFEFTWDTSAYAENSGGCKGRLYSDGTHVLTVVARDAAGNIATSAPVSIVVSNPDVNAPTVSITAPISGSTVSGTSTISVIANDQCPGRVSEVTLKLDGEPLNVGEATISRGGRYEFQWNTSSITNGKHKLVAQARDTAGNIGVSATVSIKVNNAAKIFRSVSNKVRIDPKLTYTCENDVLQFADMTVHYKIHNTTGVQLYTHAAGLPTAGSPIDSTKDISYRIFARATPDHLPVSMYSLYYFKWPPFPDKLLLTESATIKSAATTSNGVIEPMTIVATDTHTFVLHPNDVCRTNQTKK